MRIISEKTNILAEINKLGDKDQVVTYEKIEEADIPEDREFRDSWKRNGDKIDFNLDKARNIKLARIRAAREPLLNKLDKDFIMALEAGDEAKKDRIVREKTRLRDITEPLKNKILNSIDDVKNESIL
jgi:hypothetical protein